MPTCGNAERRILKKLTASPRASRAKIYHPWEQGLKGKGLKDAVQVYSGRPYELSEKYNRAGWCLKMSLACSIATMAATSRRSSRPLPRAGMWDSGECLMLNISESPKIVAAFSWSRVLDATPQWSSWLTPPQWRQYLACLKKSKSHGTRIPSLAILLRLKTRPAASTWALRFSSLKRTDGVRWLSGKESLSYMGFPSDWMTKTLSRFTRQAMPSSRPLLAGLRK